jgi:hypothetical protein
MGISMEVNKRYEARSRRGGSADAPGAAVAQPRYPLSIDYR